MAARKPVPGDRRVREVEITDRGLELVDAAHDRGRPIAEDLVSPLGDAEYELLVELLTRVTYPPSDEP